MFWCTGVGPFDVMMTAEVPDGLDAIGLGARCPHHPDKSIAYIHYGETYKCYPGKSEHYHAEHKHPREFMDFDRRSGVPILVNLDTGVTVVPQWEVMPE